MILESENEQGDGTASRRRSVLITSTRSSWESACYCSQPAQRPTWGATTCFLGLRQQGFPGHANGDQGDMF